MQDDGRDYMKTTKFLIKGIPLEMKTKEVVDYFYGKYAKEIEIINIEFHKIFNTNANIGTGIMEVGNTDQADMIHKRKYLPWCARATFSKVVIIRIKFLF